MKKRQVDDFEFEDIEELSDFDFAFVDENGNVVKEMKLNRYFSQEEIDFIVNGANKIRSKKEFIPLTQEEIEQLLDAIGSNRRMPTPKYDFSKGHFLTRKQIENIGESFEDFRRFLANNSACLFRKTVYIHVDRVDQMPYSAMLSSVSNPKNLFEFVGRRDNYILLGVPNEFSYELLDAQFRLDGKENPYKDAGYEKFYEAYDEETLWTLKKLLNKEVVSLLNRLFFKSIGLKFKCKKSKRRNNSNVSPVPEKGVLVKFECKIADTESLFTIWIPEETLMEKIDLLFPYTGKKENFVEARKMEESKSNKTADVQVGVKAIFGKAELSLKEIKRLKKGTVLEIFYEYSGYGAQLEANGTVVAKGSVVSVDDRFGIKIHKMGR